MAQATAFPLAPSPPYAPWGQLAALGDGELEGGSARQFIETSSITLHAGEVEGRCFVDIFSCKPFAAAVASDIAVEHFGGSPTLTVLRR